MKSSHLFVLLQITVLVTGLVLQSAPAEPISIEGFSDGISHWQKKFGRDHAVDRYATSDFEAIANTLLLWQNEDGGWPKDVDWLAKLGEDEMNALMGVEGPRRSTFDNHNTFPQIDYLAEAYARTGHEPFRVGALRGLNYVFQEQRPTGGWRGSDVDAITFNDGTMIGIMTLLRNISENAPRYQWLDNDTRTKASRALALAIDCTLKCQIVSGGVKTAWCQQHDHQTYQPVKARAYELPAITANESVGVVQFLMELKSPGPDVIQAVDDAVTWLKSAAIQGIRLGHPSIAPVRYLNHSADHDVVVVNDPNAPPLWARYYDLETSLPFFCNRDGVRVHTLAEVDLERRTGYGWYGDWPARLLDKEYPKWKQARAATTTTP